MSKRQLIETAPEKIIRALRLHGPMPALILAKRGGMVYNTCLNTLHRMVESGAVKREWEANPYAGEKHQRLMCHVYSLIDPSKHPMKGACTGPLPETLRKAVKNLERRGYKVIAPKQPEPPNE